jgi:glycosyltransferase involved in cell wall biosynthesis
MARVHDGLWFCGEEMSQFFQMNLTKIAIIGGDKIGWALDQDVETFRDALPASAQIVGLREANLVYSPWWKGLSSLGSTELAGKKILCGFDNPPFYWITRPDFRLARHVVGHWVCHCVESLEQARSIGLAASLVPYAIRPEIFRPLGQLRRELRLKWNLPEKAYIIGNFQRDTEGADLISPKLQKGPDVFAEIVRLLLAEGQPIHVLLAGPRRHWLRRTLTELRVPYTAIGGDTSGDDIKKNLLDRTALNELYAAIDLYLLTSRWEGGPYAVLEAAAAQCKIVSTRVGQAMDVLDPRSLFGSLPEALGIVRHDIKNNHLASTVGGHYEQVLRKHTVPALTPEIENLLGAAGGYPVFGQALSVSAENALPRIRENVFRRRIRHLFTRFRPQRKPNGGPTVSIFREYVAPPYGGGNQFMLALRTELLRRGVTVLNNKVGESIDGYILDSHWFDPSLLKRLTKLQQPQRVVHRIDGPIHLYRGKDKELDDQIFEINRSVATTSVIQSQFTLKSLYATGYLPVNPIIVRNASDPALFNRVGKAPFSLARKVRIISSSWSGNVRKGGDVYQWLDEHLDWNRFEYRFIGRAAASFKNIQQIEPVPSAALATHLKECDIYITASQNDPCSNALIEALTCGLPAVHLQSGGHPELTGFGGLGFTMPEEVPALLDQVVNSYESFQACIRVSSIKEVADAYLACIIKT